MRHIGTLAGAALIALAPTAAFAQTGASANAPLQPGSWGQGGWQAGTPGVAAAPTYAPAPQVYAVPSSGALRADPAPRMRSDYRPLERGRHVPHAYLDPSYTVVDWNDWGFSPPGPGLRWVRYYDDGLLIDGEGRVVDARYGVDWDRTRLAGGGTVYAGGAVYPGYAGGARYAYPAAVAPAYAGGATVVAPGVTTYRAGPNTTVTTAVVQAPPVIVGAPYGYAGGATVVGAPAAPVYGYAGGATVVGSAPAVPVYGYAGGASVVGTAGVLAVTTTTTTTDYDTVGRAAVAPVRRVRARPIRRVRRQCVSATCPVLGS